MAVIHYGIFTTAALAVYQPSTGATGRVFYTMLTVKYLTTPNLALETFIQCTINGNSAVNLWGWLTGAWKGKKRANGNDRQSRQIARELLAQLSVVILIGHRETAHDTQSNRPPSAFISPEEWVQRRHLLFSLNYWICVMMQYTLNKNYRDLLLWYLILQCHIAAKIALTFCKAVWESQNYLSAKVWDTVFVWQWCHSINLAPGQKRLSRVLSLCLCNITRRSYILFVLF